MFQSEYCEVIYDDNLNAVVCVWKKCCTRNDYRDPLIYGLQLLRLQQNRNWIVDTTYGFENDNDDSRWLMEEFIPKAVSSTCEHIYFILPQNSTLRCEITQQACALEQYFKVTIYESFEKVQQAITSSKP